MIHIIGAPRTGSTLLCQLIINHFRVNYFANDKRITNTDPAPVSYESEYGKTKLPYDPSEASVILQRWFGHSSKALPGMDSIIASTVQDAEPLVMKNIWNVWRIDEWERLAPCQWVWIRRDVNCAAESALQSYYKHGHINAAYAHFEGDLAHLAPSEKVYRVQKHINAIIQEKLEEKEFIEIHYNDLADRPGWVLLELEKYLKAERRYERKIPKFENRDNKPY